MREWELERRGCQRHLVARGDRLEPQGALQPWAAAVDWVIIEGASGPRVSQQSAVEYAADEHRDPALRAERQELIGPTLVEERVAAGEQKAIKLRLVCEAREGCSVVHSDTDGRDCAVRPQAV